MESQIIFREPVYFTFRFKIYENIKGLLLLSPILLLGIYDEIAFIGNLWPFNLWPLTFSFSIALAILLIVLFITLYFSPLIQSNYFIQEHFKSQAQGYVCQINFEPSRFKAIEALLEDANDLGVVQIKDDAVIFKGDSTDMVMNIGSIESIDFFNIGPRVLWAWGNQPLIKFKEKISGISGCYIHPRMGKTLPEYLRINRKFIAEMKNIKLKAA